MELLRKFACFLVLLLILGCSTDDVSEESEDPDEKIEDTHFYRALRHDGKIYEIGNNSGSVEQVLELGSEFGSNPVRDAVVATDDKVYIYAQNHASVRNELYVIEKATGEIRMEVLELPADIYGENAGVTNLLWDENANRLLGIVSEEVEINLNNLAQVVSIDPETLRIEPLNISFNYFPVVSTVLVGNEIYALSFHRGQFAFTDFFKINLSDNSVSDIEEFGDLLANLGRSEDPQTLFGFRNLLTNIAGEVEPVLIDLAKGELHPIPLGQNISLVAISHSTFFDEIEGVYVHLVWSLSGLQLLKFDPDTKEIEFTLMEDKGIDSSVFIFDVRKK